ncbi:dickkopf-like protein 1 isoform X1 [Lissotriton helveticus]
MPRRLFLLLLFCPLAWRAAAYPGFLPVGFQEVANMFREVSNLMAKTQSGTGKELGELDNAMDYNLLPPNYHTEEEDEHQVGNGTIYSRRKIDKVTDNKTGDMIFSHKTVASIKQNYHSDAELGKQCRNANDCEMDQYCHVTVFTSECKVCRAENMVCQRDAECCLGNLCVWGRCAGTTRGESGTSCDPLRDECAEGLCCTHQKSFPSPVCALPPTEGEECKSPYGSFLRMITWGTQGSSTKGYCPCAKGLVCTNKGFNPSSTCEKKERKSGFVDIRKAPFLHPIIRRDEELTDYDTDPLPWQLQDGQLAVVDVPQAAEESENEARDAIKRLREDLADGFEEEPLPIDRSIEDDMGPSQLEFEELNHLANEMGQYFGPGFY